MTLQYKDVKFTAEPDEKGFVEAYASVFNIVDKQNERVLPNAFEKAIKNPKRVKFLWQHDYKMPIGRITKLWSDGHGLKYRAKYNLNTSWGKDAYNAALAEDIDTNSIGYNPVREKCLYNSKDGVTDLGEVDLMEISHVTFPANDEAINEEVKMENEAETPEEEKIDYLIHVKGALPYHKTSLAAPDAPWDGPGEVAKADVEGLKQMCACVVGDPANKTSYKLPHHMSGGGHACVWNGVRAAYGATQGARTPTQGCGDAGVIEHLLKHYDDFGKTRPGAGKAEEVEETKEEPEEAKTEAETEPDPTEIKAGRAISSAREANLRDAADHLSGAASSHRVLARHVSSIGDHLSQANDLLGQVLGGTNASQAAEDVNKPDVGKSTEGEPNKQTKPKKEIDTDLLKKLEQLTQFFDIKEV